MGPRTRRARAWASFTAALKEIAAVAPGARWRAGHPIFMHGFRVWLRFAWRDVWLVAISGIALVAVISAQSASDDARGAGVRARAVALQASKLAVANRELLRDQQEGRATVIRLICRVDDEQNRALRAMVVEGARSSLAFEDVYRSHGQPTFHVRLKQAEAAAATLPPIDCERLVEVGRADGKVPPPAMTHGR